MNVMQETGPETLRPLGRSMQRRLELLDAADRVVMRDGPDASMNAIAAEAGVTKPILYRHFGDKEGLYRALAERHIEDLLDRLRTALTLRGGRRRRVEAAIDAYLSVIESRPQVYRFLMHRAATEHPSVFGQVTLVQRRIGEELAEGIAFDIGLSELEKPLAQAWAHGIVGMVQQAGDWWLEDRPITRQELVQHLADLVWGKFAQAPRVGGV
jgi:AcrR family transcriptional regulator